MEIFSFGQNKTACKQNQKLFEKTNIWQFTVTQHKLAQYIRHPIFYPAYITTVAAGRR